MLRLFIIIFLLASPAFAAQQTVENGDTYLEVRTKINENFTELYGRAATGAELEALLDSYYGSTNWRTQDGYEANTDSQTLGFTSPNLSISGGNSVDISTIQDGFEANTDSQTLSFTSPNLSITGGNSVDLSTIQDGTGTDDQIAAEVNITDSGAYFTGSTVEAALQEIGAGGIGGATDHGALSGLGDDDHTQYMLESNIGTVANNYIQLDASGDLPFAIGLDTTNFAGNLSATDDTLQEAMDTLDDMTAGGASALNDLSDVNTSGAVNGSVIKYNGSSWLVGTDNTAAGSGYTATVPTYSDEACTAGQYAFSTTTGYVCVSSGDWNTFALTDWNNPTPATYDLTMAITDTTGTGSTFTVDSIAATVADTPKTWTGLTSATEAVTFAANTTETSSCTGTGVTGSDPNWVVDMSSADVTDMACTVSTAASSASIWLPTSSPLTSLTYDVYQSTRVAGQYITGLSATSEISEIKVHLATVRTTQNLELRIGTGADLTTYSQTDTISVTSADTDSWVTFTLPASVTGSTAYYVGVGTGATAYGDRISIYRGTSDGGQMLSGSDGFDMSLITPDGSSTVDIELLGTL